MLNFKNELHKKLLTINLNLNIRQFIYVLYRRLNMNKKNAMYLFSGIDFVRPDGTLY